MVKYSFLLRLVAIVMVFTHPLAAAVHFVGPNAAATWAQSVDTSTPCSLPAANTNVSAGDTVYLRGGIYIVGSYGSATNQGIMPSRSGDAVNGYITYSPYQNEVVNLVGQADDGSTYSVGILLDAKSYIRVDGKSLGQLNLSKMCANIVIGPRSGGSATGNSSCNEISYVYAYHSWESDSWRPCWQGNLINKRAFYNHIHHCTFARHGYLTKENAGNEGNLFDLGVEAADSEEDRTYFNVIENNEFLHGGHATFGFFGDRNIVRNNYFHNEGWYDIGGVQYGYRDIIGNGRTGYVGYNVFEGNRLGHAAPNYTWAEKNGNWGGAGIKLCTPYNIVRYNSFFNNSGTALSLATYSTDPSISDADHNYIYNNTFYRNGWYRKLPGSDYRYAEPFFFGYNGNHNWTVMYASVLKNNLFYDNANTYDGSDVWADAYESGTMVPLSYYTDPAKGNVILENNFNTEAGQNADPLYVDPDVTNPTLWTLPNLNLQSGSPAVDAAGHLTQANGSGSSSITLVVDDARYFSDGKFGLGISGPVWPSNIEVKADWIAIGTVTSSVQIASIDYSTNTITLAFPMTWNDDAKIWLHKNSKGTVVLHGAAPDMGAYEYDDGSTVKKISGTTGFSRIPSVRAVGNGRYEVGFAGCGEVCVFDLQGRPCRVIKIRSGMTTIDLNGLSAGAYVLRTSRIAQRTVFVR